MELIQQMLLGRNTLQVLQIIMIVVIAEDFI